ncbi:hypothetical protein BDN71DRAFT_1456583 [Pleurotus eryngii]|uniref:Uncharacterized protein n=1 Tax=Pleurotus eryngii TaxID=5323 RepID=A0A9P5ZKQ0_PLEER|nr:hypothetical protein BDN71DRAFT_1456583 [Pleurotus eryngii]
MKYAPGSGVILLWLHGELNTSQGGLTISERHSTYTYRHPPLSLRSTLAQPAHDAVPNAFTVHICRKHPRWRLI